MDSVYCERNESMKVNYTIKGLPPLERKLQQISLVKWGAVANKNLTQIFNRAGRKPGTPRKTGELIRARRIQLGTSIGGKWKGSMGYAKDYGIPRAVMYDEYIDNNNPMFDLNRDLIKEQKDITIITQDNILETVKKIMQKKTSVKNKPAIQGSLFD